MTRAPFVMGKAAAIATDRRARGVANVSFGHCSSPITGPPRLRERPCPPHPCPRRRGD
jgi:hypothetical protein